MTQPKSLKQLSKFLGYILGYSPCEFGLIPDSDGFVKIKELLKAVCEEDGWRHVRWNHIREIMITETHPPIEVQENRSDPYAGKTCRNASGRHIRPSFFIPASETGHTLSSWKRGYRPAVIRRSSFHHGMKWPKESESESILRRCWLR